MDQTNFRYVTPEDIPDALDFASVDVSFISLTKILIPARNLLKAGGQMVCLIKPQFEAGRGKVGKNGVVREPQIHEEVIRKIIDYADSIGFEVLHLEYFPPSRDRRETLNICCISVSRKRLRRKSWH